MEEKILKYIKENPKTNGIDIAKEISESVNKVYGILWDMEEQGKIKKVYEKLNIYYNIL